MEGKSHIESLLKEADVYKKQGLFKESKEKYLKIMSLIQDNEELSGDQQLIDSVKDKIASVDSTLDEIDKASETPELTEETQKLISNLFSFSQNKDISAIEGAVALAKFGQYEKSLAEFQRLINEGIFPMMAAKNMLRCQVMFSSPDTAVKQFNKWASRTIFTKGELSDLKEFLENMLKKEGVSVDLSSSVVASPATEKKAGRMEDVLEISAIRIKFDSPDLKGKIVDLDITFQLGNTISFIVKADEKKMLEAFEPGTQLSNIQCYSTISLFNAKGKVSKKEKITSGPKQGNYSFDLIIEAANETLS